MHRESIGWPRALISAALWAALAPVHGGSIESARVSPAIVAAWSRFDKNGDGVLSRGEWVRFGVHARAEADADGDGRVSPEEFDTVFRESKGMPTPGVADAGSEPAPESIRLAAELYRLAAAGRHEEALRFALGGQDESGDRDWHLMAAAASLQTLLGRPREALETLAALRSGGIDEPELEILELGARLDLGEKERAEEILRTLRQRGLPPWYGGAIGWQLVYRGMWESAAEWIPPAMRADKIDNALLFAMALRGMGNQAGARQILRHFDQPASSDPAMLRLNVEMDLDLGLKNEAQIPAQEAVALQPSMPESWLALARVQDALGLHQARLLSLRKALAACVPGTERHRAIEALLEEARTGSSSAAGMTSTPPGAVVSGTGGPQGPR